MSDIMDKQCEGCMIHERHKKEPEIYHECEGFLLEDINCPCPYCLIKMMCNSACSQFSERPWVKDSQDAE